MSTSFGLLSNSGLNALSKYQNTVGDKYGNTYAQIMNGISTKNTYNGKYYGMSSSVFDMSSGITSSGSGIGSSYQSNSWQTGKDGLNRRGAITNHQTSLNSIPKTSNPYLNAGNGSSLIDNFFTSIQSVALGQHAPTSVFEQRLNYHLDYEQQRKPGSMLGNFSNYMNVDSVNQRSSSNAIFGDKTASSGVSGSGLSNASKASSVSQLMSMLG